MVEKIVDCIVKSQTSSGKIKQEENSVYLYGYTLLFEKLINIVIVLLISFVTGRWIEIWVFLFAVIPLRSFVGGWHAKKFWQCTVISNAAVILLLVIIEKIIIKNQIFYAVFEITIGILMCWLVPVQNENKPLSLEEEKKYKKISYFIWGIECCIIPLVILQKKYKYATIILYAHFIIIFAALVGRISNTNKIKKEARIQHNE